MGYKLAGYDVLGGVEIDPEMMEIYRTNHNPRHSYLMGVEQFNEIPDKDLPSELFNLDILDGSPPCSSFSMAGSREDGWGKNKKFREGQTEQVLDDLFFHFINVAEKLKPRIVIAENVKGLIQGNARGYVKEIFQGFKDIGYEVQLFLFNSALMGVPQARERTFFIARKPEIPKLTISFNERLILLKEAFKGRDDSGEPLSQTYEDLWKCTPPGKSFSVAHHKGSFFNSVKVSPNKPAPTMTATAGGILSHWKSARKLSTSELTVIQTFPDDFNFMGVDPKYVMGMSVPPYMMQRVAIECARALL